MIYPKIPYYQMVSTFGRGLQDKEYALCDKDDSEGVETAVVEVRNTGLKTLCFCRALYLWVG